MSCFPGCISQEQIVKPSLSVPNDTKKTGNKCRFGIRSFSRFVTGRNKVKYFLLFNF